MCISFHDAQPTISIEDYKLVNTTTKNFVVTLHCKKKAIGKELVNTQN
jgi:hypothetical protein